MFEVLGKIFAVDSWPKKKKILKNFCKFFACAGSFSHVQLTILPFERQTSADKMMVINDELAPKTPAKYSVGSEYRARKILIHMNTKQSYCIQMAGQFEI